MTGAPALSLSGPDSCNRTQKKNWLLVVGLICFGLFFCVVPLNNYNRFWMSVEYEYMNEPALRIDNEDILDYDEEQVQSPVVWCRPCLRFRSCKSKKFENPAVTEDEDNDISAALPLKRSYSEYIPESSNSSTRKHSAATPDFLAATPLTATATQSKSHNSFFDSLPFEKNEGSTVQTEVGMICKFFGFSPTVHFVKQDQTLNCLTYLESLQSLLKETLKSLEQQQMIKCEKTEAFALVVKEHTRITRIFERTLAKIPAESRYRETFRDILLKEFSDMKISKVITVFDMLMKIKCAIYFLKPKIKALRHYNGIKKG